MHPKYRFLALLIPFLLVLASVPACSERAEPPAVHVHIGTIEVRARPSERSTAKTPTPSAPPRPVSLGFDEYAAVRSYRGWRDV